MFSKNTFDNMRLMQRIQSAQVELSSGWKNLTEKAKKEVKVANKKARKVLATEDGGDLREEYILKVKLDSGHQLFKRFHSEWLCIHEESVKNVKLSEKADDLMACFSKEWEKYNTYLAEFHSNLQALPELLAKVEIAQKKISAIGEQVEKIEILLVEYEDAIERHDLEKQKLELKVKLSELVATKHAEFTLKKSMFENQEAPSVASIYDVTTLKSFDKLVETKIAEKEALDRQQSEEKQKAYGDAFLEQMNHYIQYGEVEKPIVNLERNGNEQSSTLIEVQIDEADLSTLREFLGPEEINSVIQAQASQNRTSKEALDNNVEVPFERFSDDHDKENDIKVNLATVSQVTSFELEHVDDATNVDQSKNAALTKNDISSSFFIKDSSFETKNANENGLLNAHVANNDAQFFTSNEYNNDNKGTNDAVKELLSLDEPVCQPLDHEGECYDAKLGSF